MTETIAQPTDRDRKARKWSAGDLTPADLAPWRNKIERYIPADLSADECWTWRGHIRRADGYGTLGRRDHSPLLAHRVAWVLLTGQSLTGQATIDHLCMSRACVNPAHLEPVTLSVNVLRKNGERSEFDHEHVPGCTTCLKRRRDRRKVPVSCEACGQRVQRKHLARHVRAMHAPKDAA